MGKIEEWIVALMNSDVGLEAPAVVSPEKRRCSRMDSGMTQIPIPLVQCFADDPQGSQFCLIDRRTTSRKDNSRTLETGVLILQISVMKCTLHKQEAFHEERQNRSSRLRSPQPPALAGRFEPSISLRGGSCIHDDRQRSDRVACHST